MTDIALTKRQYYYRSDECKARKAADADCICWHDQGTGPYPDADENFAWRASLSQVAPANPATPYAATSKNPTKETDMSKLTSKIALELVTRIETLKDKIAEVYQEANEYDGINNSNVIRDIVNARENANDQKFISDGLLEALDLDEDEE